MVDKLKITDPKFKPFLDEQQRIQQYHLSMQLAKFTDFTKVKELEVIKVINSTDEVSQVMIFGNKLPSDTSVLDKCYLYFLSVLDQIIPKSYFLVYFNTAVSSWSKSQQETVRRWLRKLPSIFFSSLQKYYLFQCTMMISIDYKLSRGYFTNQLKQKIIYVSNLLEFENQKIFKLETWQQIPKYVYESNKFQPKIFKENPSLQNPQQKQKQIQYSPLLGKNLNQLQLNKDGIPYIILLLTLYFDKKPLSMQTEGIFRKNTTLSDEKMLEQYIQNKQYEQIFELEVIPIASLLKKLFFQMPVAIFPSEIGEQTIDFDETWDNNYKIEFVNKIISQLPIINQRTLAYMMIQLSQVIQQQQNLKSNNKMLSYNLSVVFVPNFFRQKQAQMADLVFNSKIQVSFLQFLLENYKLIFSQYQLQIVEDLVLEKQQNLNLFCSQIIQEYKENSDEFFKEIEIDQDEYEIISIDQNILKQQEKKSK